MNALEPHTHMLENGEESETISSTRSSCRSGWVNAARWIQPLGVRSRVRPCCAQHRAFAIVRAGVASGAVLARAVLVIKAITGKTTKGKLAGALCRCAFCSASSTLASRSLRRGLVPRHRQFCCLSCVYARVEAVFAAHKGIRFARSARTAAVPACCTECETVRIGLPLMPSAVRRPSWLSCGVRVIGLG